jgi:hypothetical protein
MTQAPSEQEGGHAPDHVPVLLAEVMEALRPAPGQTIIDGTFGAGGYSRAFLAAGARVIAFDRDPSARTFARALEAAPGFRFVLAPFSAMESALAGEAIDAIALDLGLSSMQLDQAERGFSLMRDGPLDMRMSGQGPTAADLVNGEEPEALARIFFMARSANPGVSPRPSSGGGRRRPSRAPSIWPRRWSGRWAAGAGRGFIPPRGFSKPYESRLIKNLSNWKVALRRRSEPSRRGGGWPWLRSIRWKIVL